MMKKRFVVSVALVLMVLFSASLLLAQEKAPADKEKASCKKEMKLTDEQKAKIEELKTAHRMKAIDLRAEQAKLRLTFRQEWMKSEPSRQELENLVKQLSAVREKIQMNTIEHLLAARKLLGPDWRIYLKEAMGEGREMMGESEMPEAFEGEGGPMMRGMMSPMAGEGERWEPGERRVMRIIREWPGGEPGRRMGEGRMGEGRMGPMGEGREGMKGGCMMRMSGTCRCGSGSHRSSWDTRMFRPAGRGSCCSHMGGCMMMQGMGCKGGMKACCKGGMKAGCKGTSCKGGEAPKEGKCPFEMKKEAEKKE